MRKSTCYVAMLLVGMTAGSVRADIITYEYSTVLSKAQFTGPDTAGLIGATVDIKASVGSTAHYIDCFSIPAVVMNDDATITISGASVAANNGTFHLPQEAFFPTFAGLFTYPAGFFQQFNLPSGGVLTTELFSNASAAGSSVHIGDQISLLDFAPATSRLSLWDVNFDAFYNQNDVKISATLSVPEPSSLALLGLGVLGLAVNAYRRRRLSA